MTYFILFFIMYVWDVVGRDRASTLYIYESVPGVLLILMRVALMVWFMYGVIGTFKEETDPHKKDFYKVTCVQQFFFLFLSRVLVLSCLSNVASLSLSLSTFVCI